MPRFRDLISRVGRGVKKGVENLAYVDDYIKQKLNYRNTPPLPYGLEGSYNYTHPKSIADLKPKPSPMPTQEVQEIIASDIETPALKENPGLIMGKYARSKERNQDTDSFLNQIILPITRDYSLPDALVAGQFAAEGRTGGLGASRNNFFNIGAYDNDINNTFAYDSPEAGITAYAKLLAENPLYAPNATMSATPEIALKKIAPRYASRPDYAEWIMSLPEWQLYR